MTYSIPGTEDDETALPLTGVRQFHEYKTKYYFMTRINHREQRGKAVKHDIFAERNRGRRNGVIGANK